MHDHERKVCQPTTATKGEDACYQFEQEAESAVSVVKYFISSFLLSSDEKFQGFMQSRMAALERQLLILMIS